MQTTTTDTNQLNSLLRGEMSAIETYRQALEKVGDSAPTAHVDQLRAIQRDHRDAADRLWREVERHGGKPSEGSGPWGTFAKTVQGAAKLFGDKAALKALKEGEEHGLKDYEDALTKELPADVLTAIRQFIPKQREHITVLDRLIEQV
jgi:uncharacterized protein (TIGR02284 family)